MAEPAKQSGIALEKAYQFILWPMPTVEQFPRSQKFLPSDRLQGQRSILSKAWSRPPTPATACGSAGGRPQTGPIVVLTATQPAEAAKIDAVPKWDLFDKPGFMMPFNVAGYPAISVCAGFGGGGLPVAIQLVAKPFQEPALFRIADAFEKATPFRNQRPGLVRA
jgi:hypothetical protein